MKTSVFAFLAALLLAGTESSAALIDHNSVLRTDNCFSGQFRNYDAWMTFLRELNRKNTPTEEHLNRMTEVFKRRFPAADFRRFKAGLDCEFIRYEVAGRPVLGYVIRPKNADEEQPVLVYNRGGNADFGSVAFASMVENLFPVAERGFIIIGSQYGGVGIPESEIHDEFGGRDVDDVVALFDLIPHIEGADPERIGMFGGSRGGMQTFLTLRRVDGVDAVAVIAGESDLQRGLHRRPEMQRVYEARIPGYADNAEEELSKRSVLNWVDELPEDVPILLLHGEADQRVHVEQARWLADALEKAGHPHKLVIYPGDNHFLSKHTDQKEDELVAWFEQHLDASPASSSGSAVGSTGAESHE